MFCFVRKKELVLILAEEFFRSIKTFLHVLFDVLTGVVFFSVCCLVGPPGE